MARDNSQFLAEIHRHNDFFCVSMAGNFRLFFLSLGRVFDKRKETAKLCKVKQHLCQNDRQKLADKIDQVYANHRDTIDRIRSIRNKSIAHTDLAFMDTVFEENQITPNQIKALIDELCDVLNRIRAELEYPNCISGGERNRRAVQFLLETLQSNSVNTGHDAGVEAG